MTQIRGVLIVALAVGLSLTLSGAPAPATPAPEGVAAASAEAKRVGVRPGRYEGRFRTNSGQPREAFVFWATRDRKIRQFRAALDTICNYGTHVEVVRVGFRFPTITIKRSGYFKRRWRPNPDTDILIRGRMRGNRLVSGFLDYQVEVCVRTAYLKAKRVSG